MGRSHQVVWIILVFCALRLTTSYDTTTVRQISSDVHSNMCPTWHRPSKDYNSSHLCECGDRLYGIVKCSDKYDGAEVGLLACYCMSQSELLNKTIVGNCIYTCSFKYKTNVPNERSALDNHTCQPLKRTGQLCGDCVAQHAPPIYSYNIECVECTSYATNWLKYIAVAFLPLTVFYVILVVFRISASVPKLRCFILVCQISAMPGHLRYIYTLQKTYFADHKVQSRLVEVTLSLLSFWNLDFFRASYEPFCIHPRVQSLGVLALDYLTAIYPLLLIFITYCCIKLYDNFYIVHQLLKPVHKCCFYMRKEWNIHRSLTDAFGTFLLLSYVKVLNISFDLLIPTTIYDMNGESSSSYLYYSGTVEMFKGDHIPYAILAITMMFVFNVVPLCLLLLYPCKCFQKLVNSCKLHCQTLHVFMDIFSGCYRTRPFDCRYFSAVYLIIRIINLITFSLTLSRYYYPFAATLSLLVAMIITVVQPYRNHIYNKLDTCLLLTFTFGYIAATAYALSPIEKMNTTLVVMMILTCISLLSYLASLIIYWTIPHRLKEQIKIYVLDNIYHRSRSITQDEDFIEATDYLNSSTRELRKSSTYNSIEDFH